MTNFQPINNSHSQTSFGHSVKDNKSQTPQKPSFGSGAEIVRIVKEEESHKPDNLDKYIRPAVLVGGAGLLYKVISDKKAAEAAARRAASSGFGWLGGTTIALVSGGLVTLALRTFSGKPPKADAVTLVKGLINDREALYKQADTKRDDIKKLIQETGARARTWFPWFRSLKVD